MVYRSSNGVNQLHNGASASKAIGIMANKMIANGATIGVVIASWTPDDLPSVITQTTAAIIAAIPKTGSKQFAENDS
jgi:hypothetical protein